MKVAVKFILLAVAAAVTLLVAIGAGSVYIPPLQTAQVMLCGLFDLPLPRGIDEVTQSILLKIRIPRAFLAFISGSGLAVSGVMMQSVLRNPLASSLTLGVSSGAALGACLAIMMGFTFFGALTVPFFGLTFGIVTVFAAVAVATKLDRGLQNNSIILTGMAFSLFANSGITIITTFSREELQQLVFWQMGSFAQKSSAYPAFLFPILIVCVAAAFFFSRRMDIMTLGDEQAISSGVNAKNFKIFLLSLSAVLTGTIISVSGVIGFVDLFTPHIARRIFGASHRLVLPASALLGGSFMVVCDLIARTIAVPLEIPVGAITALFGAPFFLYVYFGKNKGAC